MSKAERNFNKDRRRFIRSMGAAAGLAGLGAHLPVLIHPRKTHYTGREEGLIEAVVLGSAQDGGLPQTTCTKAHCEAARNDLSLRRRSPCLALMHHGERKSFLIDAGPDLASQLEDLPQEWYNGRNPVAGVFLTHAHIGHYAGLAQFGREVLGSSRIPVYCSEKMARFLKDNGPWSLLVELKNIELYTIKAGDKIEIATGLSIEPVEIPHRAEFTDTFAFIVHGRNKKLLFLPDIDRWEQLEMPIESLIEKVDIALLDGTFYSGDELPGRDMSKIPHPLVADSAKRLGKIAAAGKKEIIFIHLNHSNLLLDADGLLLRKLRESSFDIGHDGMSFSL